MQQHIHTQQTSRQAGKQQAGRQAGRQASSKAVRIYKLLATTMDQALAANSLQHLRHAFRHLYLLLWACVQMCDSRLVCQCRCVTYTPQNASKQTHRRNKPTAEALPGLVLTCALVVGLCANV
jgi:hypothetical protein